MQWYGSGSAPMQSTTGLWSRCKKLGSKRALWDNLRSHFRHFRFRSMRHLYEVILDDRAKEVPLPVWDTSWWSSCCRGSDGTLWVKTRPHPVGSLLMVIPRASPSSSASKALTTACMHHPGNRPFSHPSLCCHKTYGGTGLTVPHRPPSLTNHQSPGNCCQAGDRRLHEADSRC